MPSVTNVAVVTGAAGRIGSALMHRLAAAGYTVVGLDLPEVCPSGDDRFLGCDITDEEQVHAAVARVEAAHGRLDVLVNNAGLTALGSVTDHSVAAWRRVLDVNCTGPLICTRAALPALARTRGRIVVIGSVAGFAPVVGRPAYVAAKHAVTGLFTALRPELAAQGVAVTLVHPAFVAGGGMTAAHGHRDAGRTTTGRQVTPDRVARAVVTAVTAGKDLVLPGATAKLAWWVHRLAPGTYTRLMARRLARGDPLQRPG